MRNTFPGLSAHCCMASGASSGVTSRLMRRSMGLLSQRGAPDWHPASQDLKDACAKAAAYCQEKGVEIEKLAMQFSTSMNPRIATTLFSSANPANVLKNIAYVNDPLDESLVAEVQEIIGNQMFVRWKNT